MVFKSVSEVVATLGNKGFADSHVTQVNKGTRDKPRWLDVIEWHEAVRMLDEAFGPFGWDAEIVSSHTEPEHGFYTVDLTLTGRAVDDETGEVVTLKRPGRGLGQVPPSAMDTAAEHDRQAHGAKSDAITNATKALGDGFGLFLYKKDRPQSAAPANGGQSRPAQNGASNGNGRKYEPSPAQFGKLMSVGFSRDQIKQMTDEGTWKQAVDAAFGTGEYPIQPEGNDKVPASAKAPAKKPAKVAVVAEEETDEIPW